VAPDNYNLTQVVINHSANTAFARIFGMTTFNASATAVAAHRPCDVNIVLDFSGSMNNESDLWNNETYLGSVNNSSNNTDPVFPQFGWYDTTFSPLALMQCTSSDTRVGKCNVTQTVLGIPPLVNDYYQQARGASPVAAFTPAPSTITNTAPGGDKPLVKLSTTTPAKTVQEITGSSTAPFTGYATYNGTFNGYTQGPGYWGKTFFLWPPDPDPTKDWRKQFFFLSDGVTPLNDNTKLFSSSGVLNDPAGNYVINYKAILNWIQKTGPIPFPPMLRAGRILYYDQVPSDVPAAAYNHTNPNSAIADPNQRFWKEYIDYVLGVWRDPYGNINRPANPACSIGSDFTCGSSTGGAFIQVKGPDLAGLPGGPPGGTGAWQRIDPLDNPKRPRHRFWFGPMTLVQYCSDTGINPGNAHDISMYPAKLGIAGALEDIRNNHPNDLVSLLLFSRPHFTGEPPEAGNFNPAQFSLSRDYTDMENALWFPPNSSTLDVRPWDSNGVQTPRAHGDYCANTTTNYGFMLAYNQFSSSAALRGTALGGLGRKGAQRLVVLETDGMANCGANAGFTNTGGIDSFFNLGPTDGVTPGADPTASTLAVANQICAPATGSPYSPGFATTRKPVIIHCIAFGAVFEPTASGSEASSAISLLQQISAIGGTGFPSSVTATGDPNYYKLCIGTLDDRKNKLRTAFLKIMDDGVPVVLVK
jgi:hypothetical protein